MMSDAMQSSSNSHVLTAAGGETTSQRNDCLASMNVRLVHTRGCTVAASAVHLGAYGASWSSYLRRTPGG
jgi:hypothetical protein